MNIYVLSFLEAPVAKTLTDFWRLIWQEHPPTVVMITNLKEGEKVTSYILYVYTYCIMKFTHACR